MKLRGVLGVVSLTEPVQGHPGVLRPGLYLVNCGCRSDNDHICLFYLNAEGDLET